MHTIVTLHQLYDPIKWYQWQYIKCGAVCRSIPVANKIHPLLHGWYLIKQWWG